MFMNHISSLDKEAYSSPSCSIIEVVVETTFLSGDEITIDDWEYAGGKL